MEYYMRLRDDKESKKLCFHQLMGVNEKVNSYEEVFGLSSFDKDMVDIPLSKEAYTILENFLMGGARK